MPYDVDDDERRRLRGIVAISEGEVNPDPDEFYPIVAGDYWTEIQTLDNGQRMTTEDGAFLFDGVLTTVAHGPALLTGRVEDRVPFSLYIVEGTKPGLFGYPLVTGDYWTGWSISDDTLKFDYSGDYIDDIAAGGTLGAFIDWDDDAYRGLRVKEFLTVQGFSEGFDAGFA